MATLPSGSSASISFLDIYNNINSTSGTPGSSIGLKDLSETLADGSIVNPLTTSKRAALRAAPYAIDEVWGANYPSSILSNMTIKRGGSTETQFVDGETLQVGYDITADWDPDPYDSGDSIDNIIQIIDSSDNVDLSGTNTITDSAPSGTQTKSFSSLALVAGIYDVKIILDSSNNFNQIVNSSAFTHYDQLENGSTSITNGTQYVDAEDESVTNVVLTPTVNTGVQASTSIGTTVLTGGDGGNISVTNTTGTTYSVQNTPGNLRFNIIHIGNPSQARNNTTSTATVDIRYTNAIDSITQSQGNVNVSAYDGSNNATFTCYSEGYSGTLTIGYDDSATASDTSYTNTTEPVSTLYVREYIDKDLTISSAGTYYPKAHHDGNAVVGSSFIVAPLLTYTTTNNQTIDVDATQVMAASVTAGTNTQVAIASSPSLQTGNTSVTFSPGTDNGVYTISYTGTANYSQVNNQTDLLTVRPKVSLGRSTATVYGIGSYTSGYTPTGVTATNVTITTEVDGTAPTYNWTKPSGTTVSGGGSGDPTVTMNFSGASGTKTFSATVTGRAVGSTNTTSTSDSIDVTYTIFTQQSISGVGPTSGDFRRGATSLPVTWTSINVAFVDVDLLGNSSGTTGTVSFVTDNDSLDVANTSEPQAYSAATPDVGFSKVGTYNVRVRDASDNLPSTTTNTEVQKINILDTAPVTPGAFQDTAGGYNGSLVMDWAVGGYRYQYELEKSDGDSNGSYNTTLATQTGTSYTLNEASSTSTYGPFYYRVRAKNFAQGGLTTEYSNYNTARRFIIFPTLDANNNIPQPNVSTIYSTTQNSTTTSTVMNVTSDSDNTNMSYSWATVFTTGASISSTTAQNPTITAGAGVGTITATLTVTADANAQSYAHSGDSITVNYYPKIVSAAYTDPVIIVNDTHVVVDAINWQGFSEVSGLQLSIRNGSGGIVGSNTTVNYSNTEGGLQTIVNKTGLSIDLGDSSSAGTMKVRIAKQSNTSFYSEFDVVISDYTSISIYGVGNGYSTPEHALRAKLGLSGAWSTTTKYFLPGISYGDGSDLYNDNEGNRYQGGTYYHGYKPGPTTDYFEVNTNGDINTIYSGDATVPPRDPTGAGNSAAQTAIAISNFSVSNYTHSNSGTTTATFSNWVTTKTVTVTWNDVSYINDGYKIHETNSSGALKGTAGENDTSEAISGITGNITFAIYAIGNSNGNPSLYSLGNTTTSYSHTNDGTLYLHATNNSGGATTNLDDITSGTTFTWDKNDLAAGVYTFRVRYGSYTGTTIATDSSVTVLAGSNITFDPTSISTIDVVLDSYAWGASIHATIAGGYAGLAGDSTRIAIATTGGSGITWKLNAQEGSDPGTSGDGSTSVTVSGTDSNVYFRARPREIGGSVGSTSTAAVTVTHSCDEFDDIVGTFNVDAEVIASGGGGRGS